MVMIVLLVRRLRAADGINYMTDGIAPLDRDRWFDRQLKVVNDAAFSQTENVSSLTTVSTRDARNRP